MGYYLNPGNAGFTGQIKKTYVDKTGLIRLINNAIYIYDGLICISRPRRFGNSYAAQMLCAYYDKTCDSRPLFAGYEISMHESFEKHLGKYDVVYLDMASLLGKTKPENLIQYIEECVTSEILRTYNEIELQSSFYELMLQAVEYTGNKFIMIIDEWDAPIRENPEIEKEYLRFLRTLFKNSGTTGKIFAAVYMTGILPIKKDGSQSAVSDFKEYTILEPQDYAPYFGFTESEVQKLCEKTSMDFSLMKRWYDGYTIGSEISMYNPFSVMCAISFRKYRSYWKKTSAAETLMTYIDMDQDGLQADIAQLITGESIIVDTDSFQNDVVTFTCKDDVLTLLIHLGYLTYEEVSDSYVENDDILTGMARIPNEEVHIEFEKMLRRSKHHSLMELVEKSDQLLLDTLSANEKTVADAINEVHASEFAPTWYNNEQSLRYVVKMAYISSVDQYAKIEELPSGHGLADVAFIPKRMSNLPVMIVELKWNKDADGALQQIKEKNYPKALENYGGEIVLVGINYDTNTKKHTCRIEKEWK